MVLALRAQLDAWADDPAITRVVDPGRGRARLLGRRRYPPSLRSRPGRAARRGAAILARRISAQRGDQEFPQALCRADRRASSWAAASACRCTARIASPATAIPFAMPEVGIGFFPDVGATWFLPRMPGELGTYCALTGERFDGADACAAGIATHRIPSARFPALLDGLDRHGVGRCAAGRLCRSRRARARSSARRAAIDRTVRRRKRRGHPRRARPRSRRRRRRCRMGGARPPPPCGPNRRSV